MDENKNGQEQEQIKKDEQTKPKKDRRKAKDIVIYVCLGIAVVCVIALFLLVYCT